MYAVVLFVASMSIVTLRSMETPNQSMPDELCFRYTNDQGKKRRIKLALTADRIASSTTLNNLLLDSTQSEITISPAQAAGIKLLKKYWKLLATAATLSEDQQKTELQKTLTSLSLESLPHLTNTADFFEITAIIDPLITEHIRRLLDDPGAFLKHKGAESYNAGLNPGLSDKLRCALISTALSPVYYQRPPGIDSHPMTTAVAWHPTGNFFITGSYHGAITTWSFDPILGKIEALETIPSHSDAVVALAWNKEGTTFASGGDQTIRLWSFDPVSRRLAIQQIITSGQQGHLGPITTIAWDRNSNMFASGSRDKRVKLWLYDPVSGSASLLQTIFITPVIILAWHPKRDFLIATSKKEFNILKFEHASKQMKIINTIYSSNKISGCAWHPHKDLFTLVGKSIALWQLDATSDNTTLLQTIPQQGKKNSKHLVWHPAGDRFMCEGKHLNVWAFDQATYAITHQQTFEQNSLLFPITIATRAAWHPKRSQFVYGSNFMIGVVGEMPPQNSLAQTVLLALAQKHGHINIRKHKNLQPLYDQFDDDTKKAIAHLVSKKSSCTIV